MKAAFDSNGGGIKGTVAALWTGVKGYFTTGFNALNTITNGKLEEIAGMFSSMKDKALSWGRDMIENFIQGIKDKIQALKDAAAEAAKPITDIFHHSHPDVGPLKDDYKWMPDMMKLYAKGIKDNAYLVTQAVDDVATDISVGMNGYSERSSDNSSVASAIMNAIDPAAIYAAVRDGASDAEITIDIDGRTLRRSLGAMGVQLA
jgi:phage-related protein